MNSWAVVQALVFEPRRAFAELRARPRYGLPLLLVLVATVALSVWYQLKVDPAWLMDLQLRNSGFADRLTEEQIAQQVQAAGGNIGMQAVIGGVAAGIAVVIFFLLNAVYLLLAGKVTNVQFGFRHWLSLVSWSSLPSLLPVIPAVITLLTATSNQIDPGAIQPLSLNALFFHRAMGEPGYTLLTSLQVTTFLSLYLSIVGVKEWSGRSWLFSTVFAALPTVLVFGIWGYYSLGRA